MTILVIFLALDFFMSFGIWGWKFILMGSIFFDRWEIVSSFPLFFLSSSWFNSHCLVIFFLCPLKHQLFFFFTSFFLKHQLLNLPLALFPRSGIEDVSHLVMEFSGFVTHPWKPYRIVTYLLLSLAWGKDTSHLACEQMDTFFPASLTFHELFQMSILTKSTWHHITICVKKLLLNSFYTLGTTLPPFICYSEFGKRQTHGFNPAHC